MAPTIDPEIHEFDIVVCGGGMGGVCAAIAAARKGLQTALVQDRSVLGGNASSEVRVHIGGATAHGHNMDARETGILEEIRLEIAVRDPLNEYTWIDTVLYTACHREAHLKIFLNTSISQVDVMDAQIRSVRGYQSGTERLFEFRGNYFVDGTGDGTIAHLAGADYRVGREARAEFNESIAPETPDYYTLGASILFCAEDRGHPVPYTPPDWALKFTTEELQKYGHRGLGKEKNHGKYWHADTTGWWWVELGGTRNNIKDNEDIRFDLQAIAYGLWDYIKNHDDRYKEEAQNFEITWIGQVPGKRESRRVLGDYILTEGDILTARVFPDQIAVGGWSIDLHPPKGFYATTPSSEHWYAPQPYSIPYRCTYSKDIKNLFLASRCLSVTHVAHGSTRLIATLACVGQAVGTAAFLCAKYGCNPADIYPKHIPELQQDLLKDDQYLLGIVNEDPDDKARLATVTATCEHPCEFGDPQKFTPLYFPMAQRFYLPPGEPENSVEMTKPKVWVYLKNELDQTVQVTGGVRRDPDRFEFTGTDDLVTFEVKLPGKYEGWVELIPTAPFNFSSGGAFWVYLNETDGLFWGQSPTRWPGFRRGYLNEETETWQTARPGGNQFFDGLMGARGTFCFKITGVPSPFPASTINNGEHRPFYSPNLWISAPTSSNDPPVEVRVTFPGEEAVEEIRVTMDTDLDKPYPHQGYGWENEYDWPIGGKAPTCIKDFDIFTLDGAGNRKLLAEIRGNYQRQVIIRPKSGKIRTHSLVLVPRATWGTTAYNIYEIRVY